MGNGVGMSEMIKIWVEMALVLDTRLKYVENALEICQSLKYLENGLDICCTA